jgi:hypothetical protein
VHLFDTGIRVSRFAWATNKEKVRAADGKKTTE